MDLSFRLDAEGGQGKVAKLEEGEGEEKGEQEGKEAAGRHLGTLTAHHHTPLGDRRQPQGQSSPVERSQVTLVHTQRLGRDPCSLIPRGRQALWGWRPFSGEWACLWSPLTWANFPTLRLQSPKDWVASSSVMTINRPTSDSHREFLQSPTWPLETWGRSWESVC